MNLFGAVGTAIEKYGALVRIETDGDLTEGKAFVEPLRYRNRIYIGGQYRLAGMDRKEKYLYVGTVENALTEDRSVVEANGARYIVKRSELYYAGDVPVYIWAILQPCGEALEDEYEAD